MTAVLDRGIARARAMQAAAEAQTHDIVDVVGLQDALNGKAAATHTHSAYEASGTAAGLIDAHESDADPHPVYLTKAEADALYAAAGSGGGGLTQSQVLARQT